MGRLTALLLLCCFHLAALSDPQCVIELECAECVPDNLPLVTSHRAANGSVRAAEGDELVLSCAGGKFLLYPLHGVLAAACEAGRLRVRQDGALRHLLELGCQENVFEDVLHEVEGCGAPLQGRSYQLQAAGGTRHLAALCFDADRGLAVRAHARAAPHNALRMPPHEERAAPRSLLGNFNHMFDASTRAAAERLFADDAHMNRRLHELLRHDAVAFAAQRLTSARLLSPHYFEDQNMRVADFVSNKVAVWESVARGNLQHLQRDVARLLRAAPRALDVHSGTHGTMALRTGEGARAELWLKPGRFPAPRYVWTVVHDAARRRALAVVLLNDPFVAVSEIKASVLCDSACGRAGWLRELRRARRYETPLMGLVFCCDVHSAADVIAEIPRAAFRDVPRAEAGMLFNLEP